MRRLTTFLAVIVALATVGCASQQTATLNSRGEIEVQGKGTAGPVTVNAIPVTPQYKIDGWAKVVAQFPQKPYLTIDGDYTTTVSFAVGATAYEPDAVLIRVPEPSMQVRGSIPAGVRVEAAPSARAGHVSVMAPNAAVRPEVPPAPQMPASCVPGAVGDPCAAPQSAAPMPAADSCAPAPSVSVSATDDGCHLPIYKSPARRDCEADPTWNRGDLGMRYAGKRLWPCGDAQVGVAAGAVAAAPFLAIGHLFTCTLNYVQCLFTP